ncbi:MAG: O-methyltransferase [Bacilli bacterium]|nr:O-methyltransferase [Bacilli bacterium]
MNKITSLNKLKYSENLLLIKEKALREDVPIVSDDVLTYLVKTIKLLEVKNILEIGTAIGYSSISMAINSVANIDTIERNEANFNQAIENIRMCKLNERIKVFNEDALTIDLKLLKDHYDLIFIDAAKAQMRKFFEKFSPKLSFNGVIIIDNLNFHGLVYGNIPIKNKNLKSLVRKIAEFNLWLSQKEDFETYFFSIGDGMAICRKKNE